MIDRDRLLKTFFDLLPPLWRFQIEGSGSAFCEQLRSIAEGPTEVEIVRNRLSGALDLLAGNLADVSVDQDTDDLVRSLLVAAGALAACGARAEATAVARAASAQAATSGIGLDQWEQDALAKLVALGRTNGNGAADPSPLLEAGEALGLALETVKELVERR